MDCFYRYLNNKFSNVAMQFKTAAFLHVVDKTPLLCLSEVGVHVISVA